MGDEHLQRDSHRGSRSAVSGCKGSAGWKAVIRAVKRRVATAWHRHGNWTHQVVSAVWPVCLSPTALAVAILGDAGTRCLLECKAEI